MVAKVGSNRPVLILVAFVAVVLALVAVVLAAGLGVVVWRYYQAPLPVLQVHASYPGASAQVVADTVAAPIESQVDGVEGLLSMSRQCTDDGAYRLTLTFRRGTDLNIAQVLVQNRVSLALPLLPDVVKQGDVRVIRQPAP